MISDTYNDEDEDNDEDANSENNEDDYDEIDNEEPEMSYWELECRSAECVMHSLEKVYIFRVNVDFLESIKLLNFFLIRGEVLQTITIGYDEGAIDVSVLHALLLLSYPWASENLTIQYIQET